MCTETVLHALLAIPLLRTHAHSVGACSCSVQDFTCLNNHALALVHWVEVRPCCTRGMHQSPAHPHLAPRQVCRCGAAAAGVGRGRGDVRCKVQGLSGRHDCQVRPARLCGEWAGAGRGRTGEVGERGGVRRALLLLPWHTSDVCVGLQSGAVAAAGAPLKRAEGSACCFPKTCAVTCIICTGCSSVSVHSSPPNDSAPAGGCAHVC